MKHFLLLPGVIVFFAQAAYAQEFIGGNASRRA